MGYDVTLGLERVDQRTAFDAAAARLGREYPIETWGRNEPSEWDIKRLWDSGSAFADFTNGLKWECEKVSALGDMAGAEALYIPVEVLVGFGKVVDALDEAVGEELQTAKLLGLASEDDADEYWGNLCSGAKARKVVYARVPVIGSVTLSHMRASVIHDDPEAYWRPISKAARDAVDEERFASFALDRAREMLALAEGGDARKDAEKAVGEAAERLEQARAAMAGVDGATRPAIDTVDLGGSVSLDGRIVEHDASFEVEEHDATAGHAFKAKVIGAITSVPVGGADRMFLAIYELLSEHPGYAPAWLRHLAEIGEVAEEAGFDRLVWEAGW